MEDDDQPETVRKSPIPVPPIPDLAAGETGRESPIPDSAGIGNREIPRFPIRPGPGIAVPGPGIGVPRAARRGFPGLAPAASDVPHHVRIQLGASLIEHCASLPVDSLARPLG